VRDEKGESKNGTIEALDETDAAKKLQEQGLVVVLVEMLGREKSEIIKEVPNIPKEEKEHADKKIIFLYGFLAFFCLVIVALFLFVNIRALQEKDFFEKTKQANKIESYREFLKRYPKGKFAEQAHLPIPIPVYSLRKTLTELGGGIK
jgi:hypothetical protein